MNAGPKPRKLIAVLSTTNKGGTHQNISDSTVADLQTKFDFNRHIVDDNFAAVREMLACIKSLKRFD